MEASVASRTSEFAHLERQLDAADADIELVKKGLTRHRVSAII